MTPKQRVISQIEHRETDFVPYNLPFDKNFSIEELNSYYGNDSWQTKLDNHITMIGIDNIWGDLSYAREYGDGIATDPYGVKWRVDKRPMHMIKPALDRPSLADYEFPDADAFFNKGWEERAWQLADEKKDYFLVAHGFSFHDRTWFLRGLENFLTDLIEYPDFCKELIEGMFECDMAILEKFLASGIPIDGVVFGDDYGYQEGIIIGAERWRELNQVL